MVYKFGFCFLGVLVWNWISPWPSEWWSRYFFITSLCVTGILGIVSTFWFLVGGVIDLRQLFVDLDGVIVSTDEYHYLAWKELADEKGFSFSRQNNECLRGGSSMETLEIILGDASRDYSEADKVAMVEHQNTIYRQLLSKLQADEILPGVMDCLDQLKAQGVKVGIGSSSKDAAFILQAIGLNAVFDAVVDVSCITRSKPDPEVFTLAAQQLAVEPGACLVVEDAEAGIEAALAAGMAVLAVGPAASDPRAHLKAGDLSQVTIEAMLQVRGLSAHTISAMNRYEKVDTFAESMLAQLSLEEKVSLCHAGSKFATNPVPRLNIPAFEMSDGPHGVRHEISKTRWEPAGWDDDHASYLPCGTAQAATWNRELMARCGAVLGAEATFEYAENAAYESLHDQLPGGVHGQNFSVIWETELTAPEAGTYHFGFMTDGLAELLLNGKTLCQTDCDAHRHVASANLSLEAGEVV